jgi:hypothetical protein
MPAMTGKANRRVDWTLQHFDAGLIPSAKPEGRLFSIIH